MTYKQELNPPLKLQDFSNQELMGIGLESVAYIRRVEVDGNHRYAVHGADGKVLSIAKDKSAALVAMLANDLEPVTLH